MGDLRGKRKDQVLSIVLQIFSRKKSSTLVLSVLSTTGKQCGKQTEKGKNRMAGICMSTGTCPEKGREAEEGSRDQVL